MARVQSCTQSQVKTPSSTPIYGLRGSDSADAIEHGRLPAGLCDDHSDRVSAPGEGTTMGQLSVTALARDAIEHGRLPAGLSMDVTNCCSYFPWLSRSFAAFRADSCCASFYLLFAAGAPDGP